MGFQFKKNFFKIILVNSLLLFVILVFLEVIAKFFNGWAAKELGLNNLKFNIDPAVGHAHDIKNFDIFEKYKSLEIKGSKLHSKINNNKKGKKSLKISVFGGSTTDPLGLQFSGKNGTWPYRLNEIINKNTSDLNVEILNFGIRGASSSQELIRLIASTQFSIPKIFISYNGINEKFFSHDHYLERANLYAPNMILEGINGSILDTSNGRFFKCKFICIESTEIYKLFTYTSHWLRSDFRLSWKLKGVKPLQSGFRNSKYLLVNNKDFINSLKKEKKLTKEIKEELINASELWFINVNLMHAIASSLNSKYYVVLQPTYGLGLSREQMIEHAKVNIQKNIYSNIVLSHMMDNGHEVYNYIYKHLRKKCELIDFCIDASAIKELTMSDDFYQSDMSHPDLEGNILIADFIYRNIIDELNIQNL